MADDLDEFELELKKGETFFKDRDLRNGVFTDKVFGSISGYFIFNNCNFERAFLEKASFSGATIASCSFRNAHAGFLNMEKTIIAQTNFRGIFAPRAKFDKSLLENVPFCGADLNMARFENARLINVDFSGAELLGTSFLYTGLDIPTLESILNAKWYDITLPDGSHGQRM